MGTPPVYTLAIPEYAFEKGKPDFEEIGAQITGFLTHQFKGRRIAFRLLSSDEHPDKSFDNLVEIIGELGHDRYDANRAGDRYENIDNARIDLFALEFEPGTDEEECVMWALDSFYEWPQKEGKKPQRVDIGIVYDPSKLQMVEHRYAGRENELKRDGFVFKDPDAKQEAILCIVKII